MDFFRLDVHLLGLILSLGISVRFHQFQSFLDHLVLELNLLRVITRYAAGIQQLHTMCNKNIAAKNYLCIYQIKQQFFFCQLIRRTIRGFLADSKVRDLKNIGLNINVLHILTYASQPKCADQPWILPKATSSRHWCFERQYIHVFSFA